MGAAVKRAQPGHHARALLTAGVLFTVGTAGHAMVSGTLPTTLGALVAAALAWAMAFGFAERRRHWAAALALVIATQIVMHVVLSAMDGHSGHASSSGSMTAMVVAHAAAALGGLLVIRHGETLIAAWVRFTNAVLGTGIVRLPAITRLIETSTRSLAHRRHPNVRTAAWSLRGPPFAV